MLQYRFVMDRLLDVPPEAFNPVAQGALGSGSPDSRGQQRNCRRTTKSSSLRWFRTAFAQRRKMLRNSLRGLLDDAQSGSARRFADLSCRGPVGR
jgi:16S rRNA (adenine1518-N6/adenine1519-N6)-dimethyltransferase